MSTGIWPTVIPTTTIVTCHLPFLPTWLLLLRPCGCPDRGVIWLDSIDRPDSSHFPISPFVSHLPVLVLVLVCGKYLLLLLADAGAAAAAAADEETTSREAMHPIASE